MGDMQHVNGRMVAPGMKNPTKLAMKLRATGTIARYDIVGCTGVQGAYLKANKASATVAADCRGPLYIAYGPSASGGDFLALPVGVIVMDTSGQSVGDQAYLGTSGSVVFVPTGFTRKIGVVATVGAAGVGEVLFDGGLAAGATIRVGTAAVAGATSVTITAATLTGAFGGLPVVATCATVSGTIHVTACTWSTNDLVITFSASYTGDVNYMIGIA